MRKIYKQLTKEQKERGVIFASTLSYYTTEQEDDTTHEVFTTDENKGEKMDRLCDDKFFNNCPYYRYNIIRR